MNKDTQKLVEALERIGTAVLTCDANGGPVDELIPRWKVMEIVSTHRAQQEAEASEPKEPSPTAGMSLAQRILHVGGRNNAAGYVEFGSIQAVEALVRQVLRDLPASSCSQDAKNAALAQARHELLNTPELHNFSEGVTLEALHQRDRWGADHDVGKEPADWFWLIGYLAGKALHAQTSGNTDKALHHTISTAAVLANWHAAITGEHTTMRPGIDPAAHGIDVTASEVCGNCGETAPGCSGLFASDGKACAFHGAAMQEAAK